MHTKPLMTASALTLAVAGIGGTFAPIEIGRALGLGTAAALPLILQLHAALLFAFAMVNWIARDSLIGGIYNRPIAVGNLAHFVIGALALVKGIAAGQRATVLLVAAAIYVVFAAAFSVVLFRSPVKSPDQA